jgi:hypothetical protein
MSDINDYLIDQVDNNFGALLSVWAALLPKNFTVWLVNRFGDIIVVFEDGSIHFLDVGIGTLTRIAESRENFYRVIDQGDNASNWLMVDLVDKCVEAGMLLNPMQVYSFKIPPSLGGTYTIDNFEPADLSVHYSLLADIWQQTKDLPDGTNISLIVVE